MVQASPCLRLRLERPFRGASAKTTGRGDVWMAEKRSASLKQRARRAHTRENAFEAHPNLERRQGDRLLAVRRRCPIPDKAPCTSETAPGCARSAHVFIGEQTIYGTRMPLKRHRSSSRDSSWTAKSSSREDRHRDRHRLEFLNKRRLEYPPSIAPPRRSPAVKRSESAGEPDRSGVTGVM